MRSLLASTACGVLVFVLVAGGPIACSPGNDAPGGVVGTGGAQAPVSGSGGVAGTGGAGSGGEAAGAGGSGSGSGGATVPPGPTDAGTDTAAPVDAPPPTGQRILLNMVTTSFRHGSEVPASRVLRDKLTALGFTVQINTDAGLFTDAGLAPFKAVVMVQASGQPAGPAAGVEALLRFIRNGGGLVGFHGASIIGYPASVPYLALIGGSFNSHPGGIRRASCEGTGTHPSVAKLAKPFVTTDEIYVFNSFNPANQVVLHCPPSGGGAPLPLSWFRNEGAGRVFYTGLGHGNELYADTAPFVNDHILPAILWAAGR